MMRLMVMLIFAQTIFSAVPAVSDEALASRVVKLLNDVCVSSPTPQAMIAAGDKIAAVEGWQPLALSAPMPLPMMHNETGPKVSVGSVWQFDLPEGLRSTLMISIVGPDLPNVKHSVCIINPLVGIGRGSLARAVELHLGSMVAKETPGFRNTDHWFFTHEKSTGNCGKGITALLADLNGRISPTALMFTDFEYPNEGNWAGPFAGTRCRS